MGERQWLTTLLETAAPSCLGVPGGSASALHPPHAAWARTPAPGPGLVVVAAVSLAVGACSDPLDPGQPRTDPESVDRPWVLPAFESTAFLSNPEETFCFAADNCEVDEDANGDLWCKCSLDGITASVDGGDGEPWPLDYPFWPLAPGWPEPWPEWPELPGTTEPPDGDGCDLMLGECDWEAEVTCPTGIPRGTWGTCYFSFQGPLDQIHSWTFSGEDGLFVELEEHQTYWSGELVQSGEVKVHFTAGGREAFAVSRIVVEPRTGSDWTWTSGNGLHYSAGTLDTGPLDWSEIIRARLCHPDKGCGAPHVDVPQDKWFVQPQNPVHGNGFIREHVSDNGPNDGAWYVGFSTVDVRMASAVNPDYASLGPVRPQGCGAIDSLNIWDFNHSICGTADSGWGAMFMSHVWSHEQLHVDKGISYLASHPGKVVPWALEALVRDEWGELNDDISEIVERSGRCFGFAAAFHGSAMSGPAHTPPNFDIWWWSSPLGEFQLTTSGTPYSADGGVPAVC